MWFSFKKSFSLCIIAVDDAAPIKEHSRPISVHLKAPLKRSYPDILYVCAKNKTLFLEREPSSKSYYNYNESF